MQERAGPCRVASVLTTRGAAGQQLQPPSGYSAWCYSPRCSNMQLSSPAALPPLPQVSEGYRPPRPPRVSAEQWALVEACWHQDPCERPAMAQVLQELGELRAKASALPFQCIAP